MAASRTVLLPAVSTDRVSAYNVPDARLKTLSKITSLILKPSPHLFHPRNTSSERLSHFFEVTNYKVLTLGNQTQIWLEILGTRLSDSFCKHHGPFGQCCILSHHRLALADVPVAPKPTVTSQNLPKLVKGPWVLLVG